MGSPPPRRTAIEFQEDTKAWRSSQVSAPEIFRWVSRHSVAYVEPRL